MNQPKERPIVRSIRAGDVMTLPGGLVLTVLSSRRHPGRLLVRIKRANQVDKPNAKVQNQSQ